MEAHNYPIFATMYHPEYQLYEFNGPKKWNTISSKKTEEIAYRFSLLLNQYGKRNSNKVKPEFDQQIMKEMAVDRVQNECYPMIADLYVSAHGYTTQLQTQTHKDVSIE